MNAIILRTNNETSKSSSNFLWCQYICREGILCFPPETHPISPLDAKFGYSLRCLKHREQWISDGYLSKRKKKHSPMEIQCAVYEMRLFCFTQASETRKEVLKHVKRKPARSTGLSLELSKRLPHAFHSVSIRKPEKHENGGLEQPRRSREEVRLQES